MKKTIAGLMLGSAILLPTQTNAEASYSFDKQERSETQQVTWTHSYGGLNHGHSDTSYPLKVSKPTFNHFNKSYGKYTYYTSKGQPEKNVYSSTERQWKKPVQKWTKKEVGQHTHKEEEKKDGNNQGNSKWEWPDRSNSSKPNDKWTPSEEVEEPTLPEPEENTPSEPKENETPSTPEVEEVPTPEKNPTPSNPGEETDDASASAVEQEVLNLVNAERQKEGLAPLQIDSKLADSARAKAKDMSDNNYHSHTSPTYGSPFDQMETFGVTYKSAAENIAQGQRSAEEVVNEWMNSPGHRQNILNANFTHIGIGHDENGNYWTQQFIGQ